MRLARPAAARAAAVAAIAGGVLGAHAAYRPGVAQVLSAEEQSLYTSTVAYCSPPGPILISAMDVRFYRQNHSLDFQLTAAALPSNLNMTAELNLFAYGRDWFNMSIDLCEIGGGSLCPVPPYNFSGSGMYDVPNRFTSSIPNVVFSVPDIEALGVLRLTKQNTNDTVGCMQVTLANGLTARSPGVLWGTVGFVLLAVVAAVATMLWRDSLSALQWRVVDIVGTLHTVVLTSMLTLIVPHVFHEYSLSFAWSFGLIYMRPMQEAIYRSRLAHGSNDSDVPYATLMEAQYARLANLYPAVSLNPDEPAVYTGSSGTLTDLFASHARRAVRRALYAPNTGAGGEMVSGGESNPVVWAAQDFGFTQTGVLYYTESLDISPNSAFLTALVCWLLVVCIAIAVFALASALWATRRTARHAARLAAAHAAAPPPPPTPPTPPTDAKADAPWAPLPARARSFGVVARHPRLRHIPQPVQRMLFQLAHPTFGRLVEIATTPLLVLIFFQWTHATGWPSHVAAAFTFAALIAAWVTMLAPMFVHVARTRDARTLYYTHDVSPYDEHAPAAKYGALAHPYRPRYYWFGTVHLVCAFLRACFVAFPQRSNLAMRQGVGLLVIDVLLFLALVLLRPGRDRWGDFVQYMLALFRIVGWALCIALTTQANLWGIPRAVLGFVLMAVTAIAIVFVFAVFVWEVALSLISRNQRWSRRFGALMAPQSIAGGGPPMEFYPVPDADADTEAKAGPDAKRPDAPPDAPDGLGTDPPPGPASLGTDPPPGSVGLGTDPLWGPASFGTGPAPGPASLGTDPLWRPATLGPAPADPPHPADARGAQTAGAPPAAGPPGAAPPLAGASTSGAAPRLSAPWAAPLLSSSSARPSPYASGRTSPAPTSSSATSRTSWHSAHDT
ncbi:hypothetical protein GLX27_001767 [Malassezia furfur]|uniref:ML-like domain-containing protein n=1 Tax=Malassezia furfur TaxID=55194 RepID=A0ABY8ERR7_MALFU|nr:hypothetical protein GLX27_001767 [Malassezia furfur]